MSTISSTNRLFDYPEQGLEYGSRDKPKQDAQAALTLKKAKQDIEHAFREGKILVEKHHPPCAD